EIGVGSAAGRPPSHHAARGTLAAGPTLGPARALATDIRRDRTARASRPSGRLPGPAPRAGRAHVSPRRRACARPPPGRVAALPPPAPPAPAGPTPRAARRTA